MRLINLREKLSAGWKTNTMYILPLYCNLHMKDWTLQQTEKVKSYLFMVRILTGMKHYLV